MSIPQEVNYRLKTIKYAKRFGIARASANYHVPPSTIYRWMKIFKEHNEDPMSLQNGSRRPKTHPRAHTAAEIKLIKDMRKRNPNLGLQDLWLRLKKRGYTRSMSSLYKVLKRLQTPTRPQPRRSPTCQKAKTYEPMSYPGERVQIDVKFVPKDCLAPSFIDRYGGSELYQYTAIDEYSRYRILWGSREHNTYASAMFLAIVVYAFKGLGIEVKCVQTDNGPEFTKAFYTYDKNNHSIFEVTAKRLHVRLKRIKPHTPKHNGKVERSHREDQKLFYSEIIRLKRFITDEEDFKRRLKRHQDKTNNRPMRPLKYQSPKQVLEAYNNKRLEK